MWTHIYGVLSVSLASAGILLVTGWPPQLIPLLTPWVLLFVPSILIGTGVVGAIVWTKYVFFDLPGERQEALCADLLKIALRLQIQERHIRNAVDVANLQPELRSFQIRLEQHGIDSPSTDNVFTWRTYFPELIGHLQANDLKGARRLQLDPVHPVQQSNA